ncbi:hypothetical protein ACFL4L_05120 [bacterium]
MDVKIENIIEKLKKEGVEEAKKASDDILVEANKKADEIVANAKKEAERMIEDAKKQASSFEENSKVAIRQAARDGELLLKERIQLIFDQVFKAEVGQTMQPEFIQTLIIKLAEQWGKDAEAEVVVSEKDLKELEKHLLGGMKTKIKTGITLKASADLSHGFQIGLKGENVYYDFSDDSIAEILKIALNPRLKEMLDV